MVVLALSASATGTWWYPLTRSNLLKTVEVVGEVLHVGQQVSVRGGDLVEVAVVTAGPPSTPWLRHHVEGRGPGRGRVHHNT